MGHFGDEILGARDTKILFSCRLLAIVKNYSFVGDELAI